MRRLLLTAALLGAVLVPPAAGAPIPTPAPAATPASAAPTGKIAITGDSFVVDDAHHLATFTGNVVVDQAKMHLTADKVVASYGAGGASTVDTFEATGHVKIVTKEDTATGEKAVFDPATRVLTLTGNVVVTNATGTVQGQDLVVNLKTNRSVFTGGKASGRVTGVFTSQ